MQSLVIHISLRAIRLPRSQPEISPKILSKLLNLVIKLKQLLSEKSFKTFICSFFFGGGCPNF